MWLVAKGARSIAAAEPVDTALAETLRIWYQGRGDHLDEKQALVLVRHARRNCFWLACDCQGKMAPPMLSPALLTEADTYYLRRLTANRPEHKVDCPFFRAQQTSRTIRTDRARLHNKPDGYFAVLKPAPVALAQAPVGAFPVRDLSSHGTPRLAKLLWRLLEVSNRSAIFYKEPGERAIGVEFAAVRAASAHIEVAPGIMLDRVLFTHPKDWHSRRVFAILRDLAKRWPKGFEPQAFLLVYATKLHEQSIETSAGTIEVATRVRHPGTREDPIAGPYLALVAVGRHPDVFGYAAQRAWAQPVHNGQRFLPIESDFDRAIVDALLEARRLLARDGFRMSAAKNMFDQITPAGVARARWIVEVRRAEELMRVILATGELSSIERTALEQLGPVLSLDERSLGRLMLVLKRCWTDGFREPATSQTQRDHQRNGVN